QEPTRAALDEAEALCKTWHGSAGGRLRYSYAPRFVLSCTEDLLREIASAARRLNARIHTHASENQDDLAAVVKESGDANIADRGRVGLLGHDVGLAHCVWLEDRERRLLAETATELLHCPSSNLKLASGIAAIPELIAAGVHVSLGADGAPCN